MDFGQFAQQKFSKLRAAFAKFKSFNFRNLRQRHRAADGMAEKGAGVNRLAGRGRPRGVHQVRAADAGRKRKAAGERLAEADQIGNHAAVLAGEPFAGAAKAGVNLVENQQRAVFVAKFAEQRQKFRRRNIDAAARLHRLDENRANFFAAENLAESSFQSAAGRDACDGKCGEMSKLAEL